ncbi:hypothetical protein [Amycolatopsis viridis]|uniref:Uncharacterized protein n=1 Tax=Amycolatopsis viridis TaxID=185678 RepID=A0ABX0SUC4_9PSEU|nr:hypothetical protein [Amycolatopsis viridis]NIH79537.1 hypothetical protein [Amycolatopsis viridis]
MTVTEPITDPAPDLDSGALDPAPGTPETLPADDESHLVRGYD